MKWLALILLILCAFVGSADATAPVTPAPDPAPAVVINPPPPVPPSPAPSWLVTLTSFAQLALPLIVPILVRYIKYGMGYIPGPLVPIIATILGAILDAAAMYLTGSMSMWGGFAGLAGIGIREIKDQLWPAEKPR